MLGLRSAYWICAATHVALATLPAAGYAQLETCWGCSIGIYDDVEMTRNFGFWTDGTKDVYVGVRFSSDLGFEDLVGVEFSVAGLGAFVTTTEFIDQPSLLIGGVAAPDDTTNGFGGTVVAWPFCSQAQRALLKITLASTGSIPSDHELRVLRRFPPTLAERPYVLQVGCDGLRRRVTGGCYLLNPTSDIPPAAATCVATAVSPATWTTVRALFR